MFSFSFFTKRQIVDVVFAPKKQIITVRCPSTGQSGILTNLLHQTRYSERSKATRLKRHVLPFPPKNHFHIPLFHPPFFSHPFCVSRPRPYRHNLPTNKSRISRLRTLVILGGKVGRKGGRGASHRARRRLGSRQRGSAPRNKGTAGGGGVGESRGRNAGSCRPSSAADTRDGHRHCRHRLASLSLRPLS